MRKAGEARDTAGPPQLFDVVEGMTDGLVAVDREWRITYVNAATVEASGTAREVLLGADHWESFPTRVGTALERDLRRVMTERVPMRSESLDEAEGRWFEVSMYPLGGDGVAYYRRDVTERRLADATHRKLERERDELLGRLQLHYERMPIACIVADNQQCIVDWNPAAERVFGYAREEVVGFDGYKLLVALALDHAMRFLDQPALGDVAPAVGDAVVDRIDRDLEPAAFRLVEALAADRHPLGHGRAKVALERAAGRGRERRPVIRTQQELARHPADLDRGRVDVRDAPLAIQGDEAVGHALDHVEGPRRPRDGSRLTHLDHGSPPATRSSPPGPGSGGRRIPGPTVHLDFKTASSQA